jgi:hypothetical protein
MRARPARAIRARSARATHAVAVAASVTLGLLACAAWAGGLPVPAQTTRKLPPGVIVAHPGSRAATAGHSFDFARGIGLVEGDRKDSLWLCIADSTLPVGDSLTLISDDPDPDKDTYVTLISAAVAERLRYPSRASLPPRLNKLSDGENGRVDYFYRLVAPPGALDCCIFGYAIRSPRSEFRVVSGRAEADLDRDGVPEHFQSCASREGLWPSVWSGEPFRGPQRWTRYYYLGYDVEPNCPGIDSLSAN